MLAPESSLGAQQPAPVAEVAQPNQLFLAVRHAGQLVLDRIVYLMYDEKPVR